MAEVHSPTRDPAYELTEAVDTLTQRGTALLNLLYWVEETRRAAAAVEFALKHNEEFKAVWPRLQAFGYASPLWEDETSDGVLEVTSVIRGLILQLGEKAAEYREAHHA